MKQITLDPLERQLLTIIHNATGREFRRLGGIDTSDQAVAEDVLPIVRQWIADLAQPNYRAVIYALFACPAGKKYVDDVIKWAKAEDDATAMSVLRHVLLKIVTASSALRILEIAKRKFTVRDDWDLIIKLTRFRTTKLEALELLHAYLRQVEQRMENGERIRNFALATLREFKSLEDHDIQMWFHKFRNGPDPDLQRLSGRPASRKRVSPKSARIEQVSNRTLKELFSTSSDIDNIGAVLEKLESKFSVIVPEELRTGDILNSLPEEGICIGVQGYSDGPRRGLWLSFEDSTTIEIRLFEECGRDSGTA